MDKNDDSADSADVEDTTDGLRAMTLNPQRGRRDDCREDSDEIEDDRDIEQKPRETPQPEEISTDTVRLPFLLFVFGPTADCFFVTYLMKMSRSPVLNRSSISDHRMKIYRRYPAFIPARGKTIKAYSMEIGKSEQLRKITKWYGGSYKLIDCKISVMKREGQDYAPSTKDWIPPRWVHDRVVDGKVFIWAGDPESWELQEGHWDELCWEMERDNILHINKKTNTRELEAWEVKKRKQEDVWREEREEERRLAAEKEKLASAHGGASKQKISSGYD